VGHLTVRNKPNPQGITVNKEPATVEEIVSNIREFIAPIYLLVIGVVALTFLFRRQTTQLIQFMVIAIIVGVLLFSPEIVQSISGIIANLFG
jgi:hypothetical protein